MFLKMAKFLHEIIFPEENNSLHGIIDVFYRIDMPIQLLVGKISSDNGAVRGR